MGFQFEHWASIGQDFCSNRKARAAGKNQSIEIDANDAMRRKIGIQIRSHLLESRAVSELSNVAFEFAASWNDDAIKSVDGVGHIGLD